MYDFVIAGSGLSGSVFAYEAAKKGKRCLVLERRNHIGGNCYTKLIENIHVHMHSVHIFNTNNEFIWQYVNKLVPFEQYVHRIKVNYDGKIYSFPINLMTLYQLWGCNNPSLAIEELEHRKVNIKNPSNLKEWVLSEVGEEIFEIFYKGYSEKQWMKDCTEIPASVGRRLPIRMTFDDNYHHSKYVGIPRNGNYTQIFEKLLADAEVKLETTLDADWRRYGKQLIYTGAIDELFNYQFGPLEYRSLRFENLTLNTDNFQGTAQVNYTSKNVPWTRIIEHKWFSPKKTDKTIITYEYPEAWEQGRERYYPVNNDATQKIYNKYKELIEDDVILIGRLSSYKYIDMDVAISLAIQTANKVIK